MKRWPGSVFITLCCLCSFTSQLISVGAVPLTNLGSFSKTANVQINQEKTTDQEKKPTNTEQKPAVSLQDYLGRYEADPSMVENFVLDVFLEKDELWIKPSHSPKMKLTAKSSDSFVLTGMEMTHKFNRDAKGLVQSLTIERSGVPNIKPLTAKKLVLPAPSLKGNTTFRLKGHPNARVVAVAGSFNEWNQSQMLFAREGDEWVSRLDLAPGKYIYKFIIDGDWILDPENHTNSVLVVK